jgi:hypothetical protein
MTPGNTLTLAHNLSGVKVSLIFKRGSKQGNIVYLKYRY